MKIVKKSVCIILALISILALNACGGNGGSEKKEPETYSPAKAMTVKKIYEDYRENALRAEGTHIGQRYKFDGQVERVKVKGVYEDCVVADAVPGIYAVTLYYEGQRDFVVSLSEGDVIIFEGTLREADIGHSHSYPLKFEDVVFISKIDQLLDS